MDETIFLVLHLVTEFGTAHTGGLECATFSKDLAEAKVSEFEQRHEARKLAIEELAKQMRLWDAEHPEPPDTGDGIAGMDHLRVRVAFEKAYFDSLPDQVRNDMSTMDECSFWSIESVPYLE